MGIFARGKRLWFRLKAPDGKWRSVRSEYFVGQERQASSAFRGLVDRISSGAELVGNRAQPVTVAEYCNMRWFETRRGLVENWARDESKLKRHVLASIGSMRLEDVRARHLAAVFLRLRQGHLSPKSIHNVYGVVRALFRDAVMDGLVDNDPCILTKHQLGENVDADSEWRATAIYSRGELEALVSDSRISFDRRVMYALQGIGGVRHGEAAGLRWRHWDESSPILGRLIVATSYDKGHTKTKVARYMPVHPTLAEVLADWKARGWAEMMGRAPKPDDLVAPTPMPTNRGPRVPRGSMRKDGYSWKRLAADLETLGLRHRRGHDLRRTFISLARSDGANKDILRRGTHQPPKEVIEGYTTFEWDILCAEVLKLRLSPGKARHTLVTSLPQPIKTTSKLPMEAGGIEDPRQSTSEIAGRVGLRSAPEGKTPNQADARKGLSPGFATQEQTRCDGVTRRRAYRPPSVRSVRLVFPGRGESLPSPSSVGVES